jgi:formate hydrogenlyase subunit 3/multisubunit Na+/H+ antiporter MnhD subunit
MLFLFRGHNGPVVRAIVGVILLAIGIALPGGALLAGIGAVLLVWGGIGALSSQRIRRQGHIGSGGRMP